MESDAAPAIAPEVFEGLHRTLNEAGPLAAIDALCEQLKSSGDFQKLFYARLMRKRVELGVSPFPTGSASDLPPATHEAYEEAIRTAGREVGGLYLDRNEIPKAWVYFRMLGEPEPVRAALERYSPGPDDDVYPAIEVAWQHAVLPEKGFDLILDRNGICSAITMVHSSDLSHTPNLKDYCTKRLIRSLHEQLTERLRGDLEGRGVTVPPGTTIPQMIAGPTGEMKFPELFGDDLYHIDVSHLASVVQLAMQLPPGPELDLARDLAAYGAKLSPNIRGENDPPFDESHKDYKVYLNVLANVDRDAGLVHFRKKAEKGFEVGMTFPAEVLVNLYLRLDRVTDALEVARSYLNETDDRQISCPSVTELARQAGRFEDLAESARKNEDPVNYLAGLIAGRTG